MKVFAAVVIALVLSGCAEMSPRLSFQTKYGTFSYELPKPNSFAK